MFRFIALVKNEILFLFGRLDFKYRYMQEWPDISAIPERTVIIVGSKEKTKWALLKCPCGCQDVLNLSLMKSVSPNWRTIIDKTERITLEPSLWKNGGCRSHFFIRRGKIIWCSE